MSDNFRLNARSWKLGVTVSMAVIATAACGTTVPTSQRAGAGAGSSGLTGGSLGGVLQGGNQTSGSLGQSGQDNTKANGQGSATGSAVGSSTGVGTNAGSGSAAQFGTPTGKGTAAGPITIGELSAQGAASYQRAAGFSHGASGDQLAMTQSVVDYINAHGGFGGRKVEILDYDLNPASVAADPSSAMQAACTYFTQDHKVVAVASYVGAPDSFYQCLAKAHVPIVTPDESVSSDFFRRFPRTVYMPTTPSYTRLLSDSVDALWNAGWLTANSKIGVVSVDTVDAHAAVDKGLVLALQRHGLKLTAGMYTSTTSSQASEYNNGVLTFNTNHVDRVFFGPGGEPVYFALAAEQQHYNPRYELGSLEYPNALAATLPADQLSGSMGLGWLPYLDLPSNKWTTLSTPGIAECRKAMASANQDFTTGNTLAIAAWICDDWMLLRDAFAAGASPDEMGIRRGAESLGETFKPAATFRTTLSVGRTHDGASLYRLAAFQDSCSCYSYTSNARPMP